MDNSTTNPWKIIGQQDIYENAWIKLTEYQVIHPGGGNGIYGKVHFKNKALGIVALDENNNIWLVGQFRFTTNSYSWEIPEGGGDLRKVPLEEAKRELLEETGLVANHWKPILNMHLSNSVSDEEAIIFLATGLSQQKSSPEPTEQLLVKKLPFEEAYQMCLRGEITDSMSVAALLKIKVLMLEEAL